MSTISGTSGDSAQRSPFGSSRSAFSGQYVENLRVRMLGLFQSDKIWKYPSLSEGTLARMLGVPIEHLRAALKSEGVTFRVLCARYRLQEAERRMRVGGKLKMKEVAINSGFGDYNTFHKHFVRKHGENPELWMKRFADKR